MIPESGSPTQFKEVVFRVCTPDPIIGEIYRVRLDSEHFRGWNWASGLAENHEWKIARFVNGYVVFQRLDSLTPNNPGITEKLKIGWWMRAWDLGLIEYRRYDP